MGDDGDIKKFNFIDDNDTLENHDDNDDNITLQSGYSDDTKVSLQSIYTEKGMVVVVTPPIIDEEEDHHKYNTSLWTINEHPSSYKSVTVNTEKMEDLGTVGNVYGDMFGFQNAMTPSSDVDGGDDQSEN